MFCNQLLEARELLASKFLVSYCTKAAAAAILTENLLIWSRKLYQGPPWVVIILIWKVKKKFPAGWAFLALANKFCFTMSYTFNGGLFQWKSPPYFSIYLSSSSSSEKCIFVNYSGNNLNCDSTIHTELVTYSRYLLLSNLFEDRLLSQTVNHCLRLPAVLSGIVRGDAKIFYLRWNKFYAIYLALAEHG